VVADILENGRFANSFNFVVCLSAECTVTKKYAVMVCFRSGDNAVCQCMRYNLYILPSPSEDFEGDVFDSPG